ncbi:anhydro-N-acetylmuramic acid kinase [Kaistia dalseonensis]|uniref:Anhydro-N-acetylmuramic acid kinase n=1 Tax=Kaistia dalseonensis TaxID=410840 RepID=A0ABU0H176_9HYPH|nr:anhydro-N-acetylmuramic acid kinase [Kaistia dalseonensis]MCX5493506.1 anhydro-N-acetylmuramic acid kinase [Kaistia dalseonensis]MDQ0436066.1 anhydro-N-acetylmuramic acid kinase [Kaistia dalseonensis]
MMIVAGLMSGTSMDGVDGALIATDGEEVEAFGPTTFRPYSDDERAVLRAALARATTLDDRAARPDVLAEAERIITDAHAEAVEALLARADVDAGRVGLVGFHGQTVFHAPARRLTIQIGDGAALARRLGIPVVYDFRAADVASGGQGAPFVPVFHRALVRAAGLAGNVAVVNIGGVGNVTRIGADGSVVAFDTGPGNALIDDLVHERTGAAMDRDGALSSAGTVQLQSLAELMDDPWFSLPPPKSLDRDAFSRRPVARLSTADAAATLAAFTAESIARAVALAGGADRIIVCGGGAHNPAILRLLAKASAAEVSTADDLGWSGDFMEAQAFAYLAARSLAGLPLSFPETTGVPYPMPGGVLERP